MFPVTRNRAFISAYRKGRLAEVFGMLKSQNPYPDRKNRKGRVTFSRAFRRYWVDGYNDGRTISLKRKGFGFGKRNRKKKRDGKFI